MKFSVAAVKSLSTLEAQKVEVVDGALVFTDDAGTVLVAIAAGHWISVRQLDINVDAKAA